MSTARSGTIGRAAALTLGELRSIPDAELVERHDA